MLPEKLVPMDVSFDIHKRVEAERRSFDEPQHVALRRLLGLPEGQAPADDERGPAATGKPWRDGHVEVPHGSDARMSYGRGKQEFAGKFLDGKLVVDGRSFDTLSDAASSLAVTKYGDHPSLNGWNYWEVRFPGETEWRSMTRMRQDARKRFSKGISINL
jgi:hypothetical protein